MSQTIRKRIIHKEEEKFREINLKTLRNKTLEREKQIGKRLTGETLVN